MSSVTMTGISVRESRFSSWTESVEDSFAFDARSSASSSVELSLSVVSALAAGLGDPMFGEGDTCSSCEALLGSEDMDSEERDAVVYDCGRPSAAATAASSPGRREMWLSVLELASRMRLPRCSLISRI